MEETAVREAFSRTTGFRITDQLSPDEDQMWRESEEDFVRKMKAASHRRDYAIDPYTEDQLGDTVSQLDALRAATMQPDRCRGDLSGSAPPVVVDGEMPGDTASDAERRTDDEYRAQIAAARPRCDVLPMLDADQVARHAADPLGMLCLTGMPMAVLNALTSTNSRLRLLRLSETEHSSRRAFQDAAGLMLYVRSSDTGGLHLFGVYGDYGVTCRISEAGWVLEGYAFTGTKLAVKS